MWTSTDGRTWRRVPLDPKVFPPGTFISGIAEGGPGLVAVRGKRMLQGSEQPSTNEPPNPDLHSLVWASPDGLTWTPASGDPFSHGQVNSITAVSDGYLAVGEADGDPVLWSSANGLSWTREADGDCESA